MHDNADNARARRAQARRATVVDVTDGAGMFLDLLAGLVGNEGLSRKASETVAVETPSASAMVDSFIFWAKSPPQNGPCRCWKRRHGLDRRGATVRPANGYAIAVIELEAFSIGRAPKSVSWFPSKMRVKTKS